jgi:hypothetical protein
MFKELTPECAHSFMGYISHIRVTDLNVACDVEFRTFVRTLL